jgi:hypothetical protein
VKQGKISQDEFNKWEKETGKTKLPERIGPMSTTKKPAPKPPPKKDLSKPGTKATSTDDLLKYRKDKYGI